MPHECRSFMGTNPPCMCVAHTWSVVRVLCPWATHFVCVSLMDNVSDTQTKCRSHTQNVSETHTKCRSHIQNLSETHTKCRSWTRDSFMYVALYIRCVAHSCVCVAHSCVCVAHSWTRDSMNERHTISSWMSDTPCYFCPMGWLRVVAWSCVIRLCLWGGYD